MTIADYFHCSSRGEQKINSLGEKIIISGNWPLLEKFMGTLGLSEGILMLQGSQKR